MTQDDINKNVDTALKEVFANTTSTDEVKFKFKFSGFGKIDELIQVMAVLGLIELTEKANRGNRIIQLTNFGHEVMRYGSWTNYLANKAEEKTANRQLIDSSINANKLNKYLLIGTSLFSLLALGVTSADFIVHRKELRVAREELRLHELEFKQQSDSIICQCQEKSQGGDSAERIKTISILKSTAVQADRLTYLLTAKEMALRSAELDDPIFQALVAVQAYNFNKDHSGYPADIDIYRALYKALERFKDPMIKTLPVNVDVNDKELSMKMDVIVNKLCSRVKRNMKKNEWDKFCSQLPYEKTCATTN